MQQAALAGRDPGDAYEVMHQRLSPVAKVLQVLEVHHALQQGFAQPLDEAREKGHAQPLGGPRR